MWETGTQLLRWGEQQENEDRENAECEVSIKVLFVVQAWYLGVFVGADGVGTTGMGVSVMSHI